MALTPPAFAAPYTEENSMYNMNNRIGESDPRRYGWSEPGREYFPSPDDWRKHPVYQIVVDRFNDADPTNNAQYDRLLYDWTTNEGPFGGFDIREMTARQGGDWRGLAAKLDYIRGMGARAMWISPVQQNTETSPMGYLGMDKTLLERRFGKLEDVRYFVDEAHKRGMYVVVDIVNNHLAEMLDWVTQGTEDTRMPFRMHRGGAASTPESPLRGPEPMIRPKAKVRKACELTPGCDPRKYQPYVDFPFDNTWSDEGTYQGRTFREAGFAGMPLGIEDLNGTGGYWQCSFHHSGEMPESEEGPWNWPLGKLYGTLDDLRTTDDEIVDRLIAASVSIIQALDIDGFRLDTPRECAFSSWTRWRTAVDAAARRLGKNNFGTWGELWSTPERAATYMGRGKDIPQYFYTGEDAAKKFISPDAPVFDGLINYNYFYWIVTVFRESFLNQTYMAFNILEWETTMGYDIEWPSFPTDRNDKVPRYQMWNFCGSHDQHRFPQFPMGFDRLRLCYAWLYTWPGIPIIYQGDEQALVTPGSGLAYWGRETMASSAAWAGVPTIRDEDGTMRNPASSNNFDQGSDYYRLYRRILNMRDLWWESAFACLGDGPNGTGLPERIECVDADSGEQSDAVFAYRRTCVPGAWGVVMLMNLGDAPMDVHCNGLDLPAGGGRIFNVLAQEDAEQRSSAFVTERLGDLARIRLRPFAVQALVDEERAFDLHVDTVSPKHDVAMPLDAWLEHRITVTFTESVDPTSVRLEVDGVAMEATAWEDGGRRLVLQLAAPAEPADEMFQEGVHKVRVLAARAAGAARALLVPYEFRVRVGAATNPIVGSALQVNHDMIVIEADGEVYLEHPAIGAEYFRAHQAGDPSGWDRASAWLPLNGARRMRFVGFRPGVPVIVQYYVDGSAAYLVTACRHSATATCAASYYGRTLGKDRMLFRGDLNQWLPSDEWSFQPPSHDSGDHNWTIDLFISQPGSSFLIDVDGQMEHVIGTGNAVTNPFFFPFETFCFGSLSQKPRGSPKEKCDAPLLGPLSDLDADLCGCDMKTKTLFLGHSGLEHTNDWMMEHFPEYWQRVDRLGRPVFHGNAFHISDASSGQYNLPIPSTICPVYSTCRVTFNDITMTFVVSKSPPGVRGIGVGSLDVSMALAALWTLLPAAIVVFGLLKRSNTVVTVKATEADRAAAAAMGGKCSAGSGDSALRIDMPADSPLPRTVLVASLEHRITYLDPTTNEPGVEKCIRGGLGKVAGILCDHHPGPLLSVHAAFCENKYEYAKKEAPIHAVVSGRPMICNVYRYERPVPPPLEDPEATSETSAQPPPPRVTWYIVDHPIFRNNAAVYPVQQTKKSALQLYALWNQAVARLIDRLQPDMFHCPDFHAAMAVMYVERPLPILVVLHNAEYQGAISTQHMGQKEARWFGEIFDLTPQRIRQECFHEGKFSMLKPAIDHARKYQEGYGVCAVSRNYALESAQRHLVLWGLPEVRGIENCMPEEELAALRGIVDADANAYLQRRRDSKLAVQKMYSLKEDADARLFVFVGRWVQQKGVDYIADVAPWMLSTYQDAQLIMIGPIDDRYGAYAKEKLEKLKKSGRFADRLFVHADFLKVPQELKMACDFCLMPSRDEPFGYVDIEFAWYGASVVGSLRGGLGKVPGFYFQILNSDSAKHMQRQLKRAITKAMECERELLDMMGAVARRSRFPVQEWQFEVLRIYSTVLQRFDWEAVGRSPPQFETFGGAQPEDAVGGGVAEPSSAKEISDGQSEGRDKVPDVIQEWPQSSRLTARSHHQLQTHRSMQGGGMHSARSHLHSYRSSLPSYMQHSARSGMYSHRSSFLSSRSSCTTTSVAESMVDVEVERRQLGRCVEEDEEKEFLHQEIADSEMIAAVEAKFMQGDLIDNAGELFEEVEWELELKRERAWVTRAIGRRIFGVPAVDWVISCLYISGPLCSGFATSMYSESAICYFAVDPLTQAFALLCWTLCARYFSPNRLMAFASLARLALLALPVIRPDPMTAAIVVGLIVPSDYLFIFYSFMGSSIGDIAKLAVRTGFIMALRIEWEWIFKGVSLSPRAVGLVIVVAAVIFSILPAVCLLYAPNLYKEFRVPGFEFKWITKLRFLLLLGAGCVIESLSYVSIAALPVLRETAPFSLGDYRRMYSFELGIATLAPMILLAFILKTLPDYAVFVVKGLACFSLPAVILRVFAHYEINQSVDLTAWLNVIIFLSVSLGSLGGYAVAVAILATIGSRWRFVCYTCMLGVFTNLARAASYGVIFLYTGSPNPLKKHYLAQELAWDLLIVSFPCCLVALAFKIAAFFFFDREATGMLRTSMQRRLEKFAKSKRSYEALQEILSQTSLDLADCGADDDSATGQAPSMYSHM